MIRNIKMLGLLVVAALALSAVIASAAQAETGTYTAGLTPSTHTTSTLTGEQEGTSEWNHFVAFGQQITCENQGVHYHGTISGGVATQVTITPTYADCTAEGLPETVTMNGCDYIFTRPVTDTGKMTAKADLTCPAGKSIDIEVFLFGTPTGSHTTKVCTIKVFATGPETEEGGVKHTVQELGGHVTYTPGKRKVGEKEYDDMTVDATITGISAEESSTCGSAKTEEAQFTSTVTLFGEEEVSNNPHDIWISEP